jgi:hypothetical protein
MMKWKGCRRKQSRPNFKVLSLNFYGGTEENYENLRIFGLRAGI